MSCALADEERGVDSNYAGDVERVCQAVYGKKGILESVAVLVPDANAGDSFVERRRSSWGVTVPPVRVSTPVESSRLRARG